MDTTLLTFIWVLIIGTIVGLLVWLGPRPSQWRTHKGPEDPEVSDPDNVPETGESPMVDPTSEEPDVNHR